MCEKETRELLKTLKDSKKEITKTKKSSREFLVELGIFTEKGNLKKNYKDLCIPRYLD